MAAKKPFFAKHAKSSAALISLIVHLIIIAVAFTFVAVTVIQKQDKKFEAKSVNRPKMELKKLQVPVDIKKKRPEPKLRKRIVAKPQMNQNIPDIKMPEISGVAGGLGNAAGGGVGDGASLGFSMPEIELFGIKGKGRGEKVVILLEAGSNMMSDDMGGIPAYTIIKNELIGLVDQLPSASLFNVIVFDDGHKTIMAFPDLVPATEANMQKLKAWLDPLNDVENAKDSGDFGLKTIGKGGTESRELITAGVFENVKKVGGVRPFDDNRRWYNATMLAQKMEADTVFLLTDKWGWYFRIWTSDAMSREEWDKTSAGKKWNAAVIEARKKLVEENKKRKAAGQAPKSISNNEWSLAGEYFPDLERPPTSTSYQPTPMEFAEAFAIVRERNSSVSAQPRSGLSKRSRHDDFSFNVIQFVPKGKAPSQADIDKFGQLTSKFKGEHKTISGLKAIQDLTR